MKKEIHTNKGIYEYEEVHLFLGRKLINPEIAKNNLKDFKIIMDKHNIRYGLMYGSLLGAVRDGGFIPWDEDVDIFVMEEDRSKVHEALFDFQNIGMKVAREEFGGELISIIRDDEYIDMYFFKRTFNGKRRSCDYAVSAHHIENRDTMDFLEMDFHIPADSKNLLVSLYGDDWHIPQRGVKPGNPTLDRKIKLFIKNKFPVIHKKLKLVLGRS